MSYVPLGRLPRPLVGRLEPSTGPTARRTKNELLPEACSVSDRIVNSLGGMSSGCRRILAALLLLPAVVFLASCGLFHRAPAPAGMGQEVVDGNFAFVVNDVSTSPTFGPARARGVWLIVSVAVRNVGMGPRPFEMAAQSLKESDGRGHSATFMEPSSVNNIDPGLQVSLRLAFDVPPGVHPTRILLRESVSSPGARVSLARLPSSTPSG